MVRGQLSLYISFTAEKHSPHPSSCGELICHFGAACVQRNGQAQCVCTTTKSCHEEEERVVCGSDGKENSTYSSVCQLRLRACNFQKDITIVRWGICPEEGKCGTFVLLKLF